MLCRHPPSLVAHLGVRRLIRLLSHAGGAEQCLACEAEHGSEAALLEDLGRLLGDVRASARCAPLSHPPSLSWPLLRMRRRACRRCACVLLSSTPWPHPVCRPLCWPLCAMGSRACPGRQARMVLPASAPPVNT